MLRKLLIVLMLLSAPLAQARMAMACTMMAGQIVERCCCEHHRQATLAEVDGTATPCCVVVMQAGDDAGMAAAADSFDKRPVKKLWDSSPDLATAPPAAIFSAAVHPSAPSATAVVSADADQSRLYLLTARLRL